MASIAEGKTVAWTALRFSQPVCNEPRFTHCDANCQKITRGQKYATSPVSVNVMTKTKGNVFGLAGGRLATPPKYSI